MNEADASIAKYSISQLTILGAVQHKIETETEIRLEYYVQREV